MRLAANETKITIEQTSVVLRPSLRAAYGLLASDGALERLHRGISDFDTSVIARIVRVSATDEDEAEHFIAALTYGGLARAHAAISAGLLAHMCALMGIPNRKDTDTKAESSSTVTLAEYFEELYRIGTGWLWWSPDATWHATPTEIEEAYAGRLSFLRAIFGNADAEKSDGPDFERDEAGVAALKAMSKGLR